MQTSLHLTRVEAGNPFADHPALREIFGERSAHVEADTLSDLSLGDADPNKNHVYLMTLLEGLVVGITGFFQPDAGDTTTLALRWHGVVPTYRGRRYSKVAFKAVRHEVLLAYPAAKLLIELVPLADALKADRLIRHFRVLRFSPAGGPTDASEFPASAALPPTSGRWQAMHHTLLPAPKARFVGKFLVALPGVSLHRAVQVCSQRDQPRLVEFALTDTQNCAIKVNVLHGQP